MKSVLLVEVLRSPAKFPSAGLAITTILVVLSMLRPGVFLWSDALAGLSQSIGVTVPLVAGLAAYSSLRRYSGRKLLTLDTCHRPALQAVAFHVMGVLLWCGLAVAVSFAIVAGYLSANNAYGEPHWPWIGANAASVLCAALVSYAVGAFIPRWYVPPLVVFCFIFGWMALTALRVPRPIAALFPMVMSGSNQNVLYIDATFIGQSVWFSSIGLLALIPLVGRAQRLLTRFVLAGLLSLSAMAGASTILANKGQVTTGHSSGEFVCSGSGPEICLHPAFAGGAPDLAAAFASLNSKVAGTPLESVRLEQQVMGIGDTPSDGARSVYVESLGPGFAVQSLDLYLQGHGGARTCESGETAAAHAAVDGWLSGRGTVGGTGTPPGLASAAFMAQTEESRVAWFADNVQDYLQCRIRLGDLSGSR